MILFPAIDLKDGKCVRLLRGDMARATVFNESPAAQATAFGHAGCEWLHLVDLNGAVEGHPVNRAAVQEILKGVEVPTQLGGGIRTIENISRWFEAGVKRVILGTIAVPEPALVKAACKQWPGQVAVGIDARDGIVAVDGWTKSSTVRALDLALRFEDAGIAAIIYTDIDRDGAMGGVNIDATITLAQHLTTPVIASGGVSSLDDLRELRPAEEHGIVGAIVGRALYDGRGTVAGGAGRGVQLGALREAGDPVEQARVYDAAGADELTFLDITASHENRDTILDVVGRTAEECFMPLTVGGGVRTIEDIRRLLLAGADKVSINSAAVARPEVVREAAEKYGH